jgi:hypothetical protein
MRHHPRFLACCALALLALPSIAGAQTAPDLVTRRQLVEQALAAREAGDHATALALFEQAGTIEMRPGLRLSIAQEQQALGRLLPSCETASRCVAELQSSLGSPESARIMPACAEIAAQTCRGFGRVRVSVSPSLAAGSEVRVQDRTVPVVDGEALSFAEPGSVRVELVREGRAVQSRNVDARPGATVTASFASEAAATASASIATPLPMVPVQAAAPAVAPAVTPHPAESAPAASVPITSRWWFWTALSVVVIGGTLGGLAAGGVFDGTPARPEGLLYTVNALRVW